jgi:large subunit ribosomal protein L5
MSMGRSVIEQRYREQAIPGMIKAFGYTNPMQVPRITKIVLNMGCGEVARDSKILESLQGNMGKIAGQKPVITKARKSVAAFKVRVGMNMGIKVTLRRSRMYSFLDRLLLVSIPRIRDFRGVPTRSFDGHGNYAMGLQEQLVFPEINYNEVQKTQGMDIIIATTAKSDDEARELLRLVGMPFRTN